MINVCWLFKGLVSLLRTSIHLVNPLPTWHQKGLHNANGPLFNKLKCLDAETTHIANTVLWNCPFIHPAIIWLKLCKHKTSREGGTREWEIGLVFWSFTTTAKSTNNSLVMHYQLSDNVKWVNNFSFSAVEHQRTEDSLSFSNKWILVGSYRELTL